MQVNEQISRYLAIYLIFLSGFKDKMNICVIVYKQTTWCVEQKQVKQRDILSSATESSSKQITALWRFTVLYRPTAQVDVSSTTPPIQ